MSGIRGRPGRISLIVARSRNGVIGIDNRLPWNLPADLRRFKALTMGHHLIMGRKTWESIGRPLPGRTSVVVTRNAAYQAPGAAVTGSLAEALTLASDDDEAFVIGGAELFAAAQPVAERIYLTTIDQDCAGDTFMPAPDPPSGHGNHRSRFPSVPTIRCRGRSKSWNAEAPADRGAACGHRPGRRGHDPGRGGAVLRPGGHEAARRRWRPERHAHARRSLLRGRDGIEQDFAEAAKWYRRLAQQGDARAQTSLGIMYARGLGFERNFPEARRLWQLADIQGDAGARYNLGVLYLQGQGVASDPARAAAYFEKAARNGHVQAQVNLGLLLREGKGVARDAEQAYYWLYVAGALGDERAAGLAAELERELTAGQAAGARRQADPLLPRNRR